MDNSRGDSAYFQSETGNAANSTILDALFLPTIPGDGGVFYLRSWPNPYLEPPEDPKVVIAEVDYFPKSKWKDSGTMPENAALSFSGIPEAKQIEIGFQTLGRDPQGFPDGLDSLFVTVAVPQVDLVFKQPDETEVPDEKEPLDPGGYVPGSSSDLILLGGSGNPQLIPVMIQAVAPPELKGTYTFSWDSNKFKLWEDSARSLAVGRPGRIYPADQSYQFFLEALRPSEELGDAELVVNYSGGYNLVLKLTLPQLQIQAHSRGKLSAPGASIPIPQRENDEIAYVIPIVENNDSDEHPESPEIMDNSDTAAGAEDDDLIALELDLKPKNLTEGVIRLQLPPNIRAFNSLGEELTDHDLSIDLENPSGKLKNIGTQKQTIFLEALPGYSQTSDVSSMKVVATFDGKEITGVKKSESSNKQLRLAVLLIPVEFVEVTPSLKYEDWTEIPNSTKPKLFPAANDMVEEPIADEIPKIAYRVLKVKVPEGVLAGEKVKWSMTPQFTPPGESEPLFRGQWPTIHPDCFEAAPGNSYGFERISQEEGRTTVDSEGFFAVRINLPPIGYNKARVKLEFEKYRGAYSEIDFEVPAVVVIDPGHGGTVNEPGSSANNATSPTGVKEKDLALSYGLALRDALKSKIQQDKLNAKVLMTRKIDVNVAGTDRAHLARDNGADAVFVIHFNASAAPHSARGTLEVRQLPSQVNLHEDVALIDPIINLIVAAITPFDAGAIKRSFVATDTSVAFDPKVGNTSTYHPIRIGYCEVEFLDNAAVDVLLNTGPNSGAVKTAIVNAMRDGILNDLKNQPAAP